MTDAVSTDAVRIEAAPDLPVEVFLDLVNRVWPGDYATQPADEALRRTIVVAAWHDGLLVGCVRVLTDGYFFAVVSEILVDARYRKFGLGKRLMDAAYEASPCSLFLGSQAGNEGFFEACGYEATMQGFIRRKARRR